MCDYWFGVKGQFILSLKVAGLLLLLFEPHSFSTCVTIYLRISSGQSISWLMTILDYTGSDCKQWIFIHYSFAAQNQQSHLTNCFPSSKHAAATFGAPHVKYSCTCSKCSQRRPAGGLSEDLTEKSWTMLGSWGESQRTNLAWDTDKIIWNHWEMP